MLFQELKAHIKKTNQVGYITKIDYRNMEVEVALEPHTISRYGFKEVMPLIPTGVKDSAGRMLYEGDIVDLQVETTEGFYRKDEFELIWSDMNAQFGLKRGNTIYLELNGDLHESKYIRNKFEA